MDVIDLPILDSQTTIVDAFARLRAANRSALVIRRPAGSKRPGPEHDYALADSGDLAVANWNKGQTLNDVTRVDADKPRPASYSPTLSDLNAARVNLLQPRDTEVAYEQLLDAADRDYGILVATWETAVIFSRHEPYLDGFSSGPLNCYCAKGHGVAGPPAKSPCKKCGSKCNCIKH